MSDTKGTTPGGREWERLSSWLRRQPPFKAHDVVPERIQFMVAEDFNGLREDLNKPNLGLATTRELLEELECRLRIGGLPVRAEKLQRLLEQLSSKTLDYRTVDE